MVASCCVLNCRRTIPTDKKEPRLSLHRFPTRNLEIRKKWIKAAGLGRPKDWKPKDHDVVCSVHFNELDYYPDQQMRRLREEAVPSNFVKESYAAREKELPKLSSSEDKNDLNIENALPSHKSVAENENSMITSSSIHANHGQHNTNHQQSNPSVSVCQVPPVPVICPENANLPIQNQVLANPIQYMILMPSLISINSGNEKVQDDETMNSIPNTVSVDTLLIGQHDIAAYKTLCRLCGVSRESSFDIFDTKHHYSYDKVINSHFKEHFLINKSDILPSRLCSLCRTKLTTWHEFYHNCLVVNKKFQQLVKKLDLSKEHDVKEPEAKANDIEVIEVTVDNIAENYDLMNESNNPKPFDISNINIQETHSLALSNTSDNEFDPLDDSPSSDTDEEPADKSTSAELTTNESQILVEVHDKVDEVNLENVKIEETVADIDYPQEEEIKVEEIPPVDENVVDEVKVTKQETVSSTSNDVVKKKKKSRRAFRMCHLCGKNYNTESGFRHHLIMHGDPSFSCHLCGSVFYEAQNLKKHLAALHSDERPFQCHLCGNKYKRKDVLQEHIKRVHDGIKRVWNKEVTRKYRYKVQKKFNYTCPYCSKVLASKTYLDDHINGVHTKEEKYKCNECSMTFTRKSSFKYHFKRAHILKKTVLEPRGTFLKDCEYCGLQFQIKKYYDQHVAAKHFNTFKCVHCEQVFDNKYQMTKHVDSVHDDIICRCQFCSKSFSEELLLKRHIYVCHTDRKPYECHQCGYKANKKATLEVHIRRHTGERPFQCDMCPRKFTQSVDYRKHRANHMKKV